MSGDLHAVASPTAVEFREATARDVEAIATLHAQSWQRTYRGVYLDSYLDGDVITERRSAWNARLTQPDDQRFTIVAHDGDDLVGFVHVALDSDPRWGALLDNLHVTNQHKGLGIGTSLMEHGAQVLAKRGATAGLYLWVIDQNQSARAFYESRGGVKVETVVRETRLGIANEIVAHRMAWDEPIRFDIDRRTK